MDCDGVGTDSSEAGKLKALQEGWYGRCVYHCDNDVVDNQTVSMEFEDDTTVTLIMHGHSHKEGRTMRYDGTRATLRGRFESDIQSIEIHDHLTGECEEVPIPKATSGHGGGDFGIVQSFCASHARRGGGVDDGAGVVGEPFDGFCGGGVAAEGYGGGYGGVSAAGGRG